MRWCRASTDILGAHPKRPPLTVQGLRYASPEWRRGRAEHTPGEKVGWGRSGAEKPMWRRKEEARTGEEPMLSSCSSGSPSTMNCRRRSSVTHWKAAVSFSSCSCVHTASPSSCEEGTPRHALEGRRQGMQRAHSGRQQRHCI